MWIKRDFCLTEFEGEEKIRERTEEESEQIYHIGLKEWITRCLLYSAKKAFIVLRSDFSTPLPTKKHKSQSRKNKKWI